MTNEDREQIALFRYGLIAPLLNGQVVSGNNYLAEVCGKVHDVPYYGRKEFTPKTIQEWLRTYRSQGFLWLKPKSRSDRGVSRVLSPELKELVLTLRQKHRLSSVMLFYEMLVSEGVILPDKVSYILLYRLLKAKNM